jgi:3-hydroxyacyl-CoA dehydrogenase
VPQASDDIVAIDVAMKLGYNWKFGPFELIDKLGTAAFAQRLQAEGKPVPAIVELAAGRPFYRVEGGKRQALGLDGEYHDVARPKACAARRHQAFSQAAAQDRSAALWDVGDGVVALEFTGKMNALDAEVMKLIGQAIPLVAEKFKAW